LHEHGTGMRSTKEKLTGNESLRRELSLVVGGRRSLDPTWRVEEVADDGDSWGKTTT
jgi:hypothetical protein